MRVLAIDVGTTNIKAALVEVSKDLLNVIEQMSLRIPAEIPEKGAYEHSPNLLISTIKSLLERFSRYNIDSAVITSYLFGLLVTDKELRPVTNVITWLDERSAEALDRVKAHSNEIYVRTGCPPLHIYAVPKIIWLREKRRDTVEKAYYYLDTKSYLIYSLTNELITDYSSASGTQLLNIHELRWDSLALELAGLEEHHLPGLMEGDQVLEIRGIRGLEKTPLVIGLYDGGSMIYSAAFSKERAGVVNLGTSAMIRVIMNKPILDDPRLMRFHTYYLINKKWIPGGAINNGGVVIEYIVKLLNKGEFDEGLLENVFVKALERIDKRYENSLAIPLLYPERIPVLSHRWRLSILGLGPENDYIDVIIAALEGILLLLKFIDYALYERNIVYDKVIVGGRLSRPLIVRRSMANIFNKSVIYYEELDLSLIGSVLLVLKALNALSTRELEEYFRGVMAGYKVTNPEPEYVTRYSRIFGIFKDLLRGLYYTV